MAISAEEVNFLVYRYLQESGHLHSAFTFAYESLVTKSSVATIHAGNVPPGALISFIQKGLMYLQVEQQMDELSLSCEMEEASNRSGSMNTSDVSIFDTEVLQTMSRNHSIRYAKWSVKHDKNRDEEEDEEEEDKPESKRKRSSALPLNKNAHSNNVEGDGGRVMHLVQSRVPPGNPERWHEGPKLSAETLLPSDDKPTKITELAVNRDESQTGSSGLSTSISSDDVVVLAGHEAEVFCCSWHPQDELLASGSGDSTVRLWSFPEGKAAAYLNTLPPSSKVLEYVAPPSPNLPSTSLEEDHDVIYSFYFRFNVPQFRANRSQPWNGLLMGNYLQQAAWTGSHDCGRGMAFCSILLQPTLNLSFR